MLWRILVVLVLALACVAPSAAQPSTPSFPSCRTLPPEFENGVYFARIVEVMDDGQLDSYSGPGTYIYASSVVSYTARYDAADQGRVGPSSPYVMGYFSSPVELWSSQPFTGYACLPQQAPGVLYFPLLALPGEATPPTSQFGHS